MPALPDGVFEQACQLLVDIDRAWVPSADGAALYVRPFMFGSEPHLSVRPANQYLFVVIASPVASYFGPELRAITVAVETSDVRATPGGTGAAKFAGNYAAGFAAHGRAGAAGHDQVLWLDAVEHRWVEELNAMNVVFVWDRDGRTVVSTPPLTGTILEGVTRDSLLAVTADAVDAAGSGVDELVVEATSIEHLQAGAQHGTLLEAFACGTAAVIAPIGRFVHDGDELVIGDGRPGPVTMDLRRRLLDVQYGRAEDPHGWVVRVPDGA
jgi:branched-chain amino acid aminotransferase